MPPALVLLFRLPKDTKQRFRTRIERVAGTTSGRNAWGVSNTTVICGWSRKRGIRKEQSGPGLRDMW